ncbi:MAG: HAD hydrolase-like protein [Ferruginibacter sp.]
MHKFVENIFFDLDGTLIDSKQRLYQLFTDLSGQTTLNFEEYWGCKRAKQTNQAILKNMLHFSDERVTKFSSTWMRLIEDEKYLAMDTLFSDTISSLECLKTFAHLYVVTARQFEQKAIIQLTHLGIESYFKKILVTEQKQSKTDLIRTVNTPALYSLIIGDTGEETNTGKELNMITVSVLTGFRNKEVLQTYKPDYIFNDLTDFSTAVRQFLI